METFHYVKRQPPPADSAQVECTMKYLEAGSKVFENGLSSHEFGEYVDPNRHWTQSLLKCMHFVQRRATTSESKRRFYFHEKNFS